MYLSAYVDKSFSGRGFISPPALGWVESWKFVRGGGKFWSFISPPALGWVESRLSLRSRDSLLSFISPPALGWVERIMQKSSLEKILVFHQPSRIRVGWKPRGDLCLFAMQGMLMLLNVSKRIKNLRIDNIFRKGWKERLLCPQRSGKHSIVAHHCRRASYYEVIL